MQNFLRNWDFMRVIRLSLGLYVIIEGIKMNEMVLILLGGIFTLMPLFNLGCSAGGSCTPRYSRRPGTGNNSGEVDYDEIK